MKRLFIIAAMGITIFLMTASTGKVKAQYDAMFTQYMFNEMFINPAYTGYKDAFAATLLHRQQWVGFQGRPTTTTLTMHMPLMQNTMGVGLSVLDERIGSRQRNLIYLSYSYRIRAGNDGYVNFGLMGGIHLQSQKLTELEVNEAGDPHLTANIPCVATPNFGFGVLYHTEKLYVGLSIPRLIDDALYVEDGRFNRHIGFSPKKFHYYITSGYAFEIQQSLVLKPQLMMKLVANAPVEFDINLNALIKQRLWAGISYRSGSDLSTLLGLYVVPQFLISYSYDFTLNRIKDFSAGSHEVALSYVFGEKSKKSHNIRYF